MERVTITDQETGADAPEETTIPTEEAPEGAPEQQQEKAPEQSTDRPEWLPDKFDGAEDLAKAYQALERKMSAKDDAEKGLITPDDLSKYEDEYLKSGSLDEGSYTELAKRGVSRELVDSFIQGRELAAEKMEGEMYQLTGGKEGYGAMTQWMTNTLTQPEIDSFNEALAQGGAMPEMAIKGMFAQFTQAGGSVAPNPPNLVQGSTIPMAEGGYGSSAEMMQDMKHPLYQAGDANFHRKVEKRLAATDGALS